MIPCLSLPRASQAQEVGRAPVDRNVNFPNFLASETVTLQAENSHRRFKIHLGLLRDKSEALAVAFDSNFREQASGIFVCSATSEDTLARFVEWAYRGEYHVNDDVDVLNRLNFTNFPVPEGQSVDYSCLLTGDDLPADIKDHPLYSHLLVYIFADTYLISQLKSYAFGKLAEYLRMLGRFLRVGYAEAVIAIFTTAFARLHVNDPFLPWIAHYGAYSLRCLREHPAFMEMVRTSPEICVRLVEQMDPALTAPWESHALRRHLLETMRGETFEPTLDAGW